MVMTRGVSVPADVAASWRPELQVTTRTGVFIQLALYFALTLRLLGPINSESPSPHRKQMRRGRYPQSLVLPTILVLERNKDFGTFSSFSRAKGPYIRNSRR